VRDHQRGAPLQSHHLVERRLHHLLGESARRRKSNLAARSAM
jgi:hypothetical protein